MAILSVLAEHEQNEFEYPPLLSAEARTISFSFPREVEKQINQLRTSTNKVGFLLQYAYFKACKRFFVADRFRKEDIAHAAKLLGISLGDIDLTTYKKKIPADHQSSILKLFDYKPFDQHVIEWLGKELDLRMQRLTEPRQIFIELLQLLYQRHIEVPTYNRLVALISQHYLAYEHSLLSHVKENLSVENREKLEELLTVEAGKNPGLLGQLKLINQSLKPKAIQASVRLFHRVHDYFEGLLPLMNSLKLSEHNCTYYTTWVKKAKLSQLKQFPNKDRTYLHLTAFLQNQFYLRQDSFVDILLKSVQSIKNTALNKLTETDQLTRTERRAAVRHLTKTNRHYKSTIDEITKITQLPLLTDTEKMQRIIALLEANQQRESEIEQKKIDLFEKSLDAIVKDKDYFKILEELSIKLQNRVNEIIKVLVFNEQTSNTSLIKAIQHFKKHDGNITKKAPLDFLTLDEKEAVADDKKELKISLYKILLFIHIADAIKSGELNLKYSYRYLSIQDYLIDKEI